MPVFAVAILAAAVSLAQTDPGIRLGAPAAGAQLDGLTAAEFDAFGRGMNVFGQPGSVTGSDPDTKPGLGPRFNHDSCLQCHSFPALGGSSPRMNPQITAAPADQVAPLVNLGFISPEGPVRVVRFISDGEVHNLFTIMGRPDTPPGCAIGQPDFALHAARGDVSFRIPTPTFGAGLIEAIPDEAIVAGESRPKRFGIQGRANRSPDDGTVARFGWKAQNRSLLITAAEAFNVEQGIGSDLFPDDPGAPDACRVVPAASEAADAAAAADFMRLLAPPSTAPRGYISRNAGLIGAASIENGRALFESVGCSECHTPSLRTGVHTIAAVSNRTADLYSDLLLHRMGALGDGISQGAAGPGEFRTAPLWGLGQRIYLLHDGRTSNLMDAIDAHAGGGLDAASEAREVVVNFRRLSAREQQDLLNFLRSL